MPYVFENRVNIIKRDSIAVVPLAAYTAGSRLYKIDFSGNSLLSSLFIKDLNGGTVAVNFFDFTLGADETPSERYDLQGHVTPADGETNRILVTQLHNKCVAEVIVTGNPTFSIYATIVDFSASDIDNALVLEGETANLLLNKGLIQAFYNPTSGTLNFGRIDDAGNICVKGTLTTSVAGAGTSLYFDAPTITTTPGTIQTLISFVVPAATTRYLRTFKGSCNWDGRFTVELNGSIIASGRTGPGDYNIEFPWRDDPRATFATDTVEIKFLAPAYAPASCVDCFLLVTDVPA